jgi:cell division protein FtsN
MMSVVIFVGVVIADQYLQKSLISPFIPPIVSSYVEQMKSWVAERKNHLNKNLEKVKQVAVRKSEPAPPIHFEFYTALPNMQVPLPEMEKNENPIVATANSGLPATISQIKKTATNISSNTIFDADRLQRALKEELQHDQYIIQLGVFKNASAAERYKSSLIASGLIVKVVNMTLGGKHAFCVQLGPYENKDEAKLVQHRLRQKNISGILRLQ